MSQIIGQVWRNVVGCHKKPMLCLIELKCGIYTMFDRKQLNYFELNWVEKQPQGERMVFDAFNSLRPRPIRRHFADDIFKCILENENGWISPRISLKFVPKVRINNIPALVQIMAWRRPGDKPLSGPMMVSLLTHICVARPQWVKR